MKSFLVGLRIVPDLRTGGDGDILVDDGHVDFAIGTHVDPVHDNGIDDGGTGVDRDASAHDGILHDAAADDTAIGHQAVDGLSASPVLVEHELGRGQDDAGGFDWPFQVVEVENRLHVSEIHVGFPVTADVSHVAPVADFLLGDVGYPVSSEIVGEDRMFLIDRGKDVLAEIV